MNGAVLFIECIVIVLFICFWGIVVKFLLSIINLANTAREYLENKIDTDSNTINVRIVQDSNNTSSDYEPFN